MLFSRTKASEKRARSAIHARRGGHRNCFFRAFSCCACVALHARFAFSFPKNCQKIAPVVQVTRGSARDKATRRIIYKWGLVTLGLGLLLGVVDLQPFCLRVVSPCVLGPFFRLINGFKNEEFTRLSDSVSWLELLQSRLLWALRIGSWTLGRIGRLGIRNSRQWFASMTPNQYLLIAQFPMPKATFIEWAIIPCVALVLFFERNDLRL